MALKVQLSKTGMATLKQRDAFAQGKIITAFREFLAKAEKSEKKGKYDVVKVLGKYSIAYRRPQVDIVRIEAVERAELPNEEAIEKVVNSALPY